MAYKINKGLAYIITLYTITSLEESLVVKFKHDFTPYNTEIFTMIRNSKTLFFSTRRRP